MMEASDNYECRGIGRGEFGTEIGDAFWTYEDGVFTLTVPKDINVNTVRLNIHCQTMTVHCSNAHITGNLTVNGNLNVDQDASISGNLNVVGNISANGSISSKSIVSGNQDVVSGAISLRSHTHMGAHGRTSEPT